VRLRGSLDVERFRRAVDQVVQRQASLRTTFPSTHGRPSQRADGGRYEFIVEKSAEGASSPLEWAKARAVDVLEANYSLESGPLFRVYLAELGPEDYLLAVGMHHVISDMWSFALIGREIATCYQGNASSLPPLEVSYAEYAIW